MLLTIYLLRNGQVLKFATAFKYVGSFVQNERERFYSLYQTRWVYRADPNKKKKKKKKKDHKDELECPHNQAISTQHPV